MNNLLNSYYYDNLDPDFYMYLYPELKLVHNIDTVEKAYEYYVNCNNEIFIPNRSEFLNEFNHSVYFYFYSSNILLDNYISDDIRNEIITDTERLSIIHYHRRGSSSYQFRNINIDSNFNPYLYKVIHRVTSDLSDEQLYMHYLNLKDSDEPIVIGNINELTYHVACNITLSVDNLVIDDTLTVKENLVVQKDAYILGNFGTDATGVFVDGGSIVVNNEYSDMDRIFSFHRLSSNSLALGEHLIEVVPDEYDSNIMRISGGNVHMENSLYVNSNLFVEQSILVGNGVVYDENYSIQSEKNLKVSGVDVNSDERFKTKIVPLDRTECYEKINKVDVKEYMLKNSKDESKPRVGVIAQEIKSLFPNVVSESYSFMPIINETVLAFTNDTIPFIPHNDITVNDTMLILNEKYEKHYLKVCEITDELIRFERANLEPSKPYLVYGKEVKDSMSVDYTQLFCYLLAAFQELSNKLEERTV